MIDFTWKVFSQTGNVETYLLLKEMENISDNRDHLREHEDEYKHQDSNL